MSWLSWNPHEARSRALVKTVTYRVFMIAITIVVAFAFTGDGVDAVNIGIAANALKTVTYYGYERAWARIRWGAAIDP